MPKALENATLSGRYFNRVPSRRVRIINDEGIAKNIVADFVENEASVENYPVINFVIIIFYQIKSGSIVPVTQA